MRKKALRVTKRRVKILFCSVKVLMPKAHKGLNLYMSKIVFA
jgi:hypothetical protein